MSEVLTFFFLLTYVPCVFAQSNISVSGIVLDKETKKPLAYSTISIKGKAIGIVTNNAGEFHFTFPEKYINDSLVVSMIGYGTDIRAIQNLVNKKALLIELSQKPIVLDEIVINDSTLTPTQIIERVIANIRFNYPQEPYSLEAFYRDFKTENGRCVGLFEAAISIYDKGYRNFKSKFRSPEQVVLNEVRKSVTVEYKADLYENFNLLTEFLRTNDVRYLTNALDMGRTKYELDRYTNLDNQQVYVIKTLGAWTSYVYINIDDFAVLKVELDAKWDGEEQNEWKMNDSIRYRATHIRKRLKFKKHNGLYFPIYNNYSWRLEGFDIGTKKIAFTTDFYQEILVNNVITKDVQKPEQKDLMNTKKVLEFQTKPYNEAFWKNYNIIKQNPLDKKLLQDLEKDVSLEGQFKGSN